MNLDDSLRKQIRGALAGLQRLSADLAALQRAAVVVGLVEGERGPICTPIANEAEVASIHRIPVREFMRPDSPLSDDIEDSAHPVLRIPVGNTWIGAPTGAILYQFRELCIAGRTTRVAHFEQPLYARQ